MFDTGIEINKILRHKSVLSLNTMRDLPGQAEARLVMLIAFDKHLPVSASADSWVAST